MPPDLAVPPESLSLCLSLASPLLAVRRSSCAGAVDKLGARNDVQSIRRFGGSNDQHGSHALRRGNWCALDDPDGVAVELDASDQGLLEYGIFFSTQKP